VAAVIPTTVQRVPLVGTLGQAPLIGSRLSSVHALSSSQLRADPPKKRLLSKVPSAGVKIRRSPRPTTSPRSLSRAMKLAAELGLPRRSDERSSIDNHPCIHIPSITRLLAPTLLGLQGSVKNKKADGPGRSMFRPPGASRSRWLAQTQWLHLQFAGLCTLT
jgi:hypothetical protein